MKLCDNCAEEVEPHLNECPSCGNTVFQINKNEAIKTMLNNSYNAGKQEVLSALKKAREDVANADNIPNGNHYWELAKAFDKVVKQFT